MKQIFSHITLRFKQIWLRTQVIYKQKGFFYLLQHSYKWLFLGKRATFVLPPKSPERPANTENFADPNVMVRASLRSLQGASIIVVASNRQIQACVERIYQVGANISFELIVVDNGSIDGTSEWLQIAAQQYPELYAAYFKSDQGFAKAVNTGIHIARGQYVIIIHQNILVMDGWLERLIAVAESDPLIGLIHPGIDNMVQAGTVPYYFTCALIKRAVINLLGGLDEGYLHGYFADEDFYLRTRLAGYRVSIAQDGLVSYHSRLSSTPNSQWIHHNRNRFYNKLVQLSTTLLPNANISKAAPRISVILRTKDRPSALLDALTSLANQTFKQFEVVLVNDGGGDIDNLVSQFNAYFPIKYIHHPVSLGRTPALNAGVKAADGEYLSYLDDDDIIYPMHFEILHDAITKEQRSFVYSDFHYVLLSEHGTKEAALARVPFISWEYEPARLLIRNYIPLHSWLHRRDLVEQIGYFNETLDSLEDWEFLLRIAQHSHLFHVRQVTCEYRIYLKSVNSVIHQRRIALDALMRIYERYASDDPIVQAERRLELQSSQVLTDKIEQLQQKIQQDPSQHEQWVKEIIYSLVPFQGYEL